MKTTTKCQILTAALGIMAIILGGGLYVFYRSKSLPLFDWVRAIGIYDWVLSVRPAENVNSWLVSSLPDGLWLLSYMLLMSALCRFHVRESMLYSAPLIVVAFVSEFLQISDRIDGTFDMVDLLCYMAAVALGFVYVKVINKSLNKK